MKGIFNKFHSILIISLILTDMFLSCAGTPPVEEIPPVWISVPTRNTETTLMFRGIGVAENKMQALDIAVDNLAQSIIEDMNLSHPNNWKTVGQKELNDFKSRVKTIIRSPEDNNTTGLSILNESAWRDGPNIAYGVEILWEKLDYDTQRKTFVSLAGITDTAPGNILEEYTRRSEAEGNLYEAALLWAAIAGNFEIADDEPGSYRALKEAIRILKEIEYKALNAPEFVFAGDETDGTITFRVTAKDKPVKQAQFILTTIAGQEIVLSDNDGRITFNLPTVTAPGTQFVSMSLDPDSFLQYLNNDEAEYAVEFVNLLTETAFSLTYEVLLPDNAISTGVLILETDLAGNSLTSNSTATGVIDNLKEAGFNVAGITALRQESLNQENEDFWNSLKTNNIPDLYNRIIYGKVSLNNFEQDGDTYIVGVNGTLYLSDIDNQKVLFSSTIEKTSRAGDVQQAMNAAFRQLGRSFAVKLINRTNHINNP